MDTFLIIFGSLVLSGFFSGMEIAFLSANRMHIELESKKGALPFRIISHLAKNPGKFIAAMLIGNNIALVVYGLLMPEVIDPLFNSWVTNPYVLLLFVTLTGTVVILFVAEFIPKAVFNSRPNEIIRYLAIPAVLFYGAFYPLVSLITAFSNFILRKIFKVEPSSEAQVFNKVDLDNFIAEKTYSTNPDHELETEIEIFQNALEFSETKVREFMVPRTEVVALNVESEIDQLKQMFIDHGYSKVLVYEENIDKIIGYVHAYELFKRPQEIRLILRPVLFIPESMTADEVLKLLIKDNRNIAVVIDEFGGTSGLVTLEDVVEEIFGEIDDEHDYEDIVELELAHGKYLFSGRHEIDYLNSTYNFELPESDNYGTLSGLILDQLEAIPEKHARIELPQYTLEVIKVSENRIEEVQLTFKGKE